MWRMKKKEVKRRINVRAMDAVIMVQKVSN